MWVGVWGRVGGWGGGIGGGGGVGGSRTSLGGMGERNIEGEEVYPSGVFGGV